MAYSDEENCHPGVEKYRHGAQGELMSVTRDKNLGKRSVDASCDVQRLDEGGPDLHVGFKDGDSMVVSAVFAASGIDLTARMKGMLEIINNRIDQICSNITDWARTQSAVQRVLVNTDTVTSRIHFLVLTEGETRNFDIDSEIEDMAMGISDKLPGLQASISSRPAPSMLPYEEEEAKTVYAKQ